MKLMQLFSNVGTFFKMEYNCSATGHMKMWSILSIHLGMLISPEGSRKWILMTGVTRGDARNLIESFTATVVRKWAHYQPTDRLELIVKITTREMDAAFKRNTAFSVSLGLCHMAFLKPVNVELDHRLWLIKESFEKRSAEMVS